jgi:fumarate reductase (CoM/CoB) subunit A
MSLTSNTMTEVKSEILIIGSEAAGAKTAIEAQEEGADVLVVTKGLVGKSGNTVMAGWGIQAPLGHMDPRDNPDVFFEDVVKGGAYLNNQKLVERLVNLSVTEIPKMEKWGARFQKIGEKFRQYQLPGSSFPRTLHPIGRHGGLHWRKALKTQLKRLKTKIIEDVFITGLLISDGQIAGAFGISLRDGQFIIFRSKITILATGGCTQIYRKTDSSIDATGDGIILAYKAGAELMDMEFHQFFPLCCYTPPFEMSTLTGSLRYELHAKFYNALGEEFLQRYLPLSKDWGLRDPTSRAIYLENKYGRGSPRGGAYISVSHLPENIIDDWIKKFKPAFVDDLEKAGINIRKHALETGPGSHYTIGGVRVNENCETSLARLYAAGEVASGMDGAERIDGGPAITWCLTMGYIAGKNAYKTAKDLDWLDINVDQVRNEEEKVNSLFKRKEGIKGFEIKDRIKDIMWEYCALVRDGKGLKEGLSLIEKLRDDDLARVCVPDSSRGFNKGLVEALEATNMVELSEIAVRAALMREETRKSHYRTDFPKRDNRKWLRNTVIKKEGEKMAFTTLPPVMTKLKPPEGEEVEE